MRASPSGKALAFQANIRGFESRRPLSRHHGGSFVVSVFQGPVAQWLAQATHNRLVAGPTPAGPTFPPFLGKIVYRTGTEPVFVQV